MKFATAFRLAAVTVALVSAAAVSPAQAKSVAYFSKHPLPQKGFCYTEGPHVHDFPPGDARLFRQVGGQFYFAGDPMRFGFQGRTFAYLGTHPISDAAVEFSEPAYCYLEGRHSHWYEPAAAIWFEKNEGAYFFVGSYAPNFRAERAQYASAAEGKPLPAKGKLRRAAKVHGRRKGQ